MTDNNKPHTSSYKSKKSLDPIFEIKFKEEESSDTQAIFEVNIINEQIEIKDDPLPPCESEKRTSEDEASYEVDIIDEQIEIKDDPVPETQTEERNISPIKEVEGHNEVQIIEEENKTVDDPIPQFENVDIKMIIEDEETNEVCFPDKQTKTKEQLGNVDTKEVIEDEENNEIRIPDQIKSIDVPGPLFENVDIKPLGEDEESNDIHVADEQTEAGDVPAPQFENVDIKIEEDLLSAEDRSQLVENGTSCENDEVTPITCDSTPIRAVKTYSKHAPVKFWQKEIQENIFDDVPEVEYSYEEISFSFYDFKSKVQKVIKEAAKKCVVQKEIKCASIKPKKVSLKGTGEFSCEKCNKRFKYKRSYFKHIQESSGCGESHTNCQECGKQLANKHSLSNHIRIYHKKEDQEENKESGKKRNTRKFLCDVCGLWFHRLKDHLLSHSGPVPKKKRVRKSDIGKRLECKYCSRSYTNTAELRRHENIHLGIKNHLCKFCGQAFSYKKTLQNHEITYHLGYFPFVCNTCGSSFINIHRLKVHEEIHSDVKNYECDICGKKCVSRKYLTDHKNHKHKLFIRKTSKPSSCKVCGKVFSTLGRLVEHENQHTVNNKYICELCKRPFESLQGLTCHLARNCKKRGNRSRKNRRNESGGGLQNKKRYGCKICGKTFANRYTSLHHVCVLSEDNSHFCGICDKYFSSHCALQNHNLISHCENKRFKCSYCEKKFALKSILNLHVRIHLGHKPYVCKCCGKHFTQKAHLKSHYHIKSGIKPFSCDICGAAFSLKPNLREHILIHLR